MTTLDQAFIRAYTQQHVVLPSTSTEPVQSVPFDDALLDPASDESTNGHADATPGEITEAVMEAAAEALAGPPAAAAAAVTEEPRNRQSGEESLEPEVPGSESLIALLRTPPADGPFFEHRVDPAHGLASLDAGAYDPASLDAGARSDGDQPASAEVVSQRDPIEGFLPLLRVEHFLWPQECLRMSREAPDQLTLLRESLLRHSQSGRKVVALGGHALGEGSTTTLLSAARSLAESGIKTIIVDADFGNPHLAERLGIACRAGWDDVLAAGQPLEEAVIESDRDRLALAPLRRPSSEANDGLDRQADLGAVLRTLRQHYDLVLVDLGKLDPQTLSGHGLGGPIKEYIDAVAVVYDVRNGRQSELDQVKQLLHEAEMVELGVIENFA